MDRDQAYQIVTDHVAQENLIHHMLAVEAAMQDYAVRLGEDPDLWGMAGLLHDYDWEIHPTLDSHPQDGAALLRERGVPESVVTCILSHADHTGVPRQTPMQKALFACDELTGLITAVALVRPSKSLYDVKLKSVRKKWKDARFAAGVDRDEVERAAQDFGVPLDEHIGNVLQSMKRIAPQLGLAGNAAGSAG
jgi:putative nucleotidyltransferase with HDIG domain